MIPVIGAFRPMTSYPTVIGVCPCEAHPILVIVNVDHETPCPACGKVWMIMPDALPLRIAEVVSRVTGAPVA